MGGNGDGAAALCGCSPTSMAEVISPFLGLAAASSPHGPAASSPLPDDGAGSAPGLTVLVLAPELYLPLRRLGAEYHASADGVAVAGRMLELIDAAPAAARGGRRIPPSSAVAPVRLERVSFAYPARAGLVIDEPTADLDPSNVVALVGPS